MAAGCYDGTSAGLAAAGAASECLAARCSCASAATSAAAGLGSAGTAAAAAGSATATSAGRSAASVECAATALWAGTPGGVESAGAQFGITDMGDVCGVYAGVYRDWSGSLLLDSEVRAYECGGEGGVGESGESVAAEGDESVAEVCGSGGDPDDDGE
jgi:hypothetical protein